MTDADTAAGLQALTDWFEGFATGAPSPLYRSLAPAVVAAPDVLTYLLDAAPAQRLPMLLFAAVHAEVLAAGLDYPRDGAAFVAFCREHEPALRATIRTRSTQTNEVGRCAYLRPGIATVADGRPLALIEVGASAGLNLNLDRYAYVYGEGLQAGDPACGVTIRTELRAGRPPLDLPPVGWRIGIDLAPAPDPAWLRACVFADQPERLARLDAALVLAAEHPPPLVEGDALALLPEVLASVPDGMQPVVFHTAVAFYLDDDERRRLDELTSQVHCVRAEQGTEAGMTVEVDGRQVGVTHPHGAWLRWTG